MRETGWIPVGFGSNDATSHCLACGIFFSFFSFILLLHITVLTYITFYSDIHNVNAGFMTLETGELECGPNDDQHCLAHGMFFYLFHLSFD